MEMQCGKALAQFPDGKQAVAVDERMEMQCGAALMPPRFQNSLSQWMKEWRCNAGSNHRDERRLLRLVAVGERMEM